MVFEAKGIIPAMVTPLDRHGNVNKTSLRQLTDYLIDGGVHGLFPVGSTGEWYGLTLAQKKDIIETVIEQANGRVPVYAGTGAITTKETVALTQMAASVGVEAVSVLTPVFISPSQEELYQHYKTIAESVNIPVLLYNNPGKTGITLEAALVERLSKIDNILGVKDSGGNLTLTGEYIRRTDAGFAVLCGTDTLILGTLCYGGKGSITATANIVPSIPVRIYQEFVKGNLEQAREAQFELAPLRLAFSLATFPVVMKEGLRLVGIDVGTTLKPVGEMTAENRAKLKKVLEDMGAV